MVSDASPLCVCLCACVRVCVRACASACVRACLRACVCAAVRQSRRPLNSGGCFPLQWPEQWTEGLDMLSMGRTTPETTGDAMRRATEFGTHLHLPRSALRSSLPSFNPESFSRAIRAFPQTHASVRRQSTRASESMVIGERPPLQLPIVRSHPGDASKTKKPAARRSRGRTGAPQRTKPVPPGPPEISLPLQVAAPDEIVLRWTAPANELEAPVECYCVEMRRVPDLDATGPAAIQEPFQAVATRMGNARRAAVRRLAQGITYEFRVRACSGGGWGVYSAIEAVPLPLGNTIVLEVVTERLLDDQIEVTWHYPAGPPPSDTVHLQWRPPDDLAWRDEYIREQELTHVLDGLLPCTDYTLRARMGSDGTWCLPFRVQTKPRLPAAPIFTRSDIFSRSVSLEFTCVDPGGQTAQLDYEVEIAQGREESEPDEELTGLDGVEVQGTTYVAKGLLPFSTYFARVRCRNSRGRSEWSEALRLQTTDSEAVPGACIVTAVPMPGQGRYASNSGGLFVEWEAPPPLQGLELTKYDLEWLPAQTDEHSEWQGRLLPATAHEFEIEDLRPGVEYLLRHELIQTDRSLSQNQSDWNSH